MDQPRRLLVIRVLAVVFSVSLATAYISCSSNDPPGDDDTDVLPSTKSAPMDYNTGNDKLDKSEDDPDSAEPDSPPAVFPGSKSNGVVLPGSKSFRIAPEALIRSSKSAPVHLPDWIIEQPADQEKNTRPENIHDPLKEIEEGSK